MSTIKTIAFLAIPWVGSLAVVSAQGTPSTTPPPPRSLDGLERKSSAVLTGYADVKGSVTYSLNDKQVLLYWSRDFTAYLPNNQISSDGQIVSVQKETVGFWPTEVCGFGTDQLCVAGKTIKGKTRIQLWTLDTTESLPAPAPSGNTFLFPDTYIPIASKVDLYHADVAGRRLVRTMFRNHGAPSRLLLQFDDNRDIQELDTATGSMNTVVTVTQEPDLQHDFGDRWSSHHALGYLYAFSWGTHILLLFDSNLDGVLDLTDTRHLTGSDWYAGTADFSDFSGYLEFF